MANEQEETQPHMELGILNEPKPNGLHADMDESDLLSELSAETVGPSYGYVKMKMTKGGEEKHFRLKIKPIDVLTLAKNVNDMPEKTRKAVLSATKQAQSTFTDDNWLQTLAAFVCGLSEPHTLKDGDEVVWNAGGEPQDLARGMIAVVKAGFDILQINEVATRVTQLTRDVRDENFLGN